MDNKKWEALRGSAGFYITLAVCLLVVGVSRLISRLFCLPACTNRYMRFVRIEIILQDEESNNRNNHKKNR